MGKKKDDNDFHADMFKHAPSKGTPVGAWHALRRRRRKYVCNNPIWDARLEDDESESTVTSHPQVIPILRRVE